MTQIFSASYYLAIMLPLYGHSNLPPRGTLALVLKTYSSQTNGQWLSFQNNGTLRRPIGIVNDLSLVLFKSGKEVFLRVRIIAKKRCCFDGEEMA